MFRQKKLNRFLYRNVRAMSLYNTGPTHRGTLKNFKVPTQQYSAHTQGNFVENLKVSTHRGKSWKNQSPQYREFFVKNQSLQYRGSKECSKKENHWT